MLWKRNNPYGEIFFGEKAPLKKEQILFEKKNNLSEKKLWKRKQNPIFC